MSIRVSLEPLDGETRRRMDRALRVKEKPPPGGGGMMMNRKEVAAYRVDGLRHIALPLAWAMARDEYRVQRPLREMYDGLRGRFRGELRPEQKAIQREAMESLNRGGAALIAVYPGGGKTITSISICSRIGMKTLVLVNRVVLMDQWRESIQRFYSDAVQIVESRDELEESADFYVMNALNVPKRRMEDFARIGTVVVDECHLMITHVFVRALTYVFPRYLIGLSATPYRPDGLDVLLDLYFGETRVVRKLFRRHAVYVLETGIEIEGERDVRGKLMWNTVLQAQMENESRNELIGRLCGFFSERTILILCKRVEHIKTLHERISRETSCTTLKGSETNYNREARVLVASIQKVGTGFSHDRLDMLILACDTEEYFLQYLGRVFRRPDVVPIVVDIVDKNPVLRRHARTRRGIYVESGGTMHEFGELFPEFPVRLG